MMVIRLFEGASALIFTGILASMPLLQRDGSHALGELKARGYRVPTVSTPLTVVPLEGGSSVHAAGWRPGVISVRAEPAGSLSPSIYLRHEIMHEVHHRSCGETLPIWVHEAAAIAFSGEVGAGDGAPPTQGELTSLRKVMRLRAPLMHAHLRTLARLISRYGWPTAPCAVSPEIERLLAHEAGHSEDLAYLLMSYSSARVLEESRGARDDLNPLGSLMKMPYMASLQGGVSELESRALLMSSTATLALSAKRLDLSRYRELLEGSGGVWSGEITPAVLLGERDPRGTFPFQLSLLQSARLLRSSLMHDPQRFTVLRQQGESDTTLRNAPRRFRQILHELDAGAKTGSVSDSKGEPLFGYLALFWPVESPTLIAVFRKTGVRGAALAELTLPLLERWKVNFKPATIDLRVALMSQLPRSAWTLSPFDEVQGCREARLKKGTRTTSCGIWRIDTTAQRARPTRLVSGIVSADERSLTTDRFTYTEAVLAAEGDDLPQAAQAALRAVIAWNAEHRAGQRHDAAESALCDTSHCMVFRGHTPERRAQLMRPPEVLQPQLIDILQRIAPQHGPWFYFSLGGNASWQRHRTAERIARLVGEQVLLDLRRESRRTGEVFLRFIYDTGEESLPCERVMALLDLPACPDAVRALEAGGYLFSGVGHGHGRGLSLERARHLALTGRGAADILNDAYGTQRVAIHGVF